MSRRLVLVLLAPLLVVGALLFLRSPRERPRSSGPADAGVAAGVRPELEPSGSVPAEELEVVAAESEESRVAVATAVAGASAKEDERALVTISARFVDEAGRPLEGIELSASSLTDSPVAISNSSGLAELVLAWEDLSGFFPQPCSFLMRGHGYATCGERQWFGAAEDRFLGEITMLPGGEVRGRVVDSAGVGVAGAPVRSVKAVLADSAERGELRTYGGQPVGTTAITRSGGSFVLEGLPVTALSVDAHAPGTFHAISAPVAVRAGEAIEIADLVLEPAPESARIGGIVRTEAGGPVPGAGVRLLDEGRNYIRGSTSTDARGAFDFTVKPGARYALQVLDYSSNGWPDVNVDGIHPGTIDLDVVFRDTLPLRVIVTGAGGRPVRRFLANVTTLDNRSVPGGHATSEDGRPVDLKAPQSPFHVRVHAPGYEHERRGPFQPEDGVEELILTLKVTTGITGRIVADGRPVAGARVEAHAALDDGRRGLAAGIFHVFVNTRGLLGDVSGANGEFFLNAVPDAVRPTRFHVHAKADGYARANSGPIELDPAQGDTELVLELVRGGAVEGRVLVGAGGTRNGRTIAMSRGDGHFETSVTDAEGRYSFADLTPGPWQIADVDPHEIERATQGSLRWVAPDEETPWDLEVRAGETTRFDLDLADRDVCRFEGRFLVDGRPPVAWAWSVPLVRDLYDESFDSEGRFSFEVEGSGRRFVQLIAPRTPGAFAGLRLEVELSPGRNEWHGAVETGTLELSGVDAPALEDVELGGQSDLAYTLLADLPDGLSWFGNVFAKESDPLRLHQVPAAHIRVYRGGAARVPGAAELEPLLELDLAPGETKLVVLE